MVDIFRKAGMEQRKIMRADFIKVIKEVCREEKSKELLQLCLVLLHANPEKWKSSNFSCVALRGWLPQPVKC